MSISKSDFISGASYVFYYDDDFGIEESELLKFNDYESLSEHLDLVSAGGADVEVLTLDDAMHLGYEGHTTDNINS